MPIGPAPNTVNGPLEAEFSDRATKCVSTVRVLEFAGPRPDNRAAW
jgi:hypothetical protein